MNIREYKDGDCAAVAKLFYETVHTVCSADYTAEQLSVWAPSETCLTARRADLACQRTLVAEEEGRIIGFGSIDGEGCLDLLFVSANCLRRGIATALCDKLEEGFAAVKTFASITARPFFERRGYAVVKEQEVVRRGVKLKNFEMKAERVNFL